jgi:hypothetical protein
MLGNNKLRLLIIGLFILLTAILLTGCFESQDEAEEAGRDVGKVIDKGKEQGSSFLKGCLGEVSNTPSEQPDLLAFISEGGVALFPYLVFVSGMVLIKRQKRK